MCDPASMSVWCGYCQFTVNTIQLSCSEWGGGERSCLLVYLQFSTIYNVFDFCFENNECFGNIGPERSPNVELEQNRIDRYSGWFMMAKLLFAWPSLVHSYLFDYSLFDTIAWFRYCEWIERRVDSYFSQREKLHQFITRNGMDKLAKCSQNGIWYDRQKWLISLIRVFYLLTFDLSFHYPVFEFHQKPPIISDEIAESQYTSIIHNII